MLIRCSVLFYWLVLFSHPTITVNNGATCNSENFKDNNTLARKSSEYLNRFVGGCCTHDVVNYIRRESDGVCANSMESGGGSTCYNEPRSKLEKTIEARHATYNIVANSKENIMSTTTTTKTESDTESSLLHMTADYTDNLVDAEYIVVFVGYYTTAARYSFIRSALRNFNSSLWVITKHSEYVSGWPSDFDVVRFTFGRAENIQYCVNDDSKISASDEKSSASGEFRRFGTSCGSSVARSMEEAALLALRRHRCVRLVSQQRRVSRVLHHFNTSSEVFTTSRGFGDGTDWADVRGSSNLHLLAAFDSGSDSGQSAILHDARRLWNELDERGQSVRVAVFDTGLNSGHAHFDTRVRERTNWTNERRVVDDLVGHGTFIAGLIAGGDSRCPGLAPAANLYIYRVFSRQQTSYTSWFLDAFNHAIARRVHVLNLSIGGTDFMDTVFVEKVRQVTASGVVMVSAIGNDGPLFGTCNNPADQSDVIGVGAIGGGAGSSGVPHMAKFSSRGMTTWELPAGYGRLKPDLVAPGVRLRGSGVDGGCRSLSGTSMAAPLVTGAVVLLVDALRRGVANTTTTNTTSANPASIKQALLASARRIPTASMFEQGAGQLQLVSSRVQLLRQQRKRFLSAHPPYLDLTECHYMWPYCSQPLYYSSQPVLANITLLSAGCVSARVRGRPVWQPDRNVAGSQWLRVAVSYSRLLWPWSGWLAVSLSVVAEAQHWQGVVRGRLSISVECGGNVSTHGIGSSGVGASVSVPVRARVIATPPRARRILWDQFHSLRYPGGYFPRDWLADSGDGSRRKTGGGFANGHSGGASGGLLDWLGDHVHTNFADMYRSLRSAGYYVEVLGEPLSCFHAVNYGTLMLVDTEDEFFDEELAKLRSDVEREGLSLLVFADWYNVSVMRRVRFYDENGRRWRLPVTGGANVPALNRLLAPWNVALGDRVLSGPLTSLFAASVDDNNHNDKNQRIPQFASGVELVRFPAHGMLVRQKLSDQGALIVDARRVEVPDALVLGLLQTEAELGSFDAKAGRIAVFGDSDCLDSSRGTGGDCFSLLTALLQFTSTGQIPSTLRTEDPVDRSLPLSSPGSPAQAPPDSQLHQYSRVLDPLGNGSQQRPMPTCGSVLGPDDSSTDSGVLQWARVSLQELDSIPEEDTDDYPAVETIDSLASLLSLPPRVSSVTWSSSKLPVDSPTETSFLTPLLVLLVCCLVLAGFWYRLRSSRSSKLRPTSSNVHV